MPIGQGVVWVTLLTCSKKSEYTEFKLETMSSFQAHTLEAYTIKEKSPWPLTTSQHFIHISCFIVFTLNETIIYRMNIMMCGRRRNEMMNSSNHFLISLQTIELASRPALFKGKVIYSDICWTLFINYLLLFNNWWLASHIKLLELCMKFGSLSFVICNSKKRDTIKEL